MLPNREVEDRIIADAKNGQPEHRGRAQAAYALLRIAQQIDDMTAQLHRIAEGLEGR